MPDYSEWLRRADGFVRDEHALPGRWSMNIEVEPPAGAAELGRLEDSLPHGLPSVLRDFYGTASSGAKCTFTWSPDKARLAEMDQILPSQYTIYGGPHLCSAGDWLSIRKRSPGGPTSSMISAASAPRQRRRCANRFLW